MRDKITDAQMASEVRYWLKQDREFAKTAKEVAFANFNDNDDLAFAANELFGIREMGVKTAAEVLLKVYLLATAHMEDVP